MSQLALVQAGTGSPPVAQSPPNLVRWVGTNNPFYVLSALLVCLGLRVSFGNQVVAAQTWSMLGGMAGYTLLLAVTACLLVRFVGVWDDVRTVLLLVVLLFLATSVTFDEVLARAPERGVACYLGGLVFAVVVSEGMLWGARLRLPPLFRLPYYLMLALFFLYPVAISPLVDQPESEALGWALFGFGPAAGLVVLTLIPAARRGRAYVRDNGSPWPWAWYPWTLFGLLACAVPARSALLCWSMHHVSSASTEPYIFGPYFLVPFGLAVGVVLLEIGLVERIQGVVRLALAVPPVLLVLAVIGYRPETYFRYFLAIFTERWGGTPLSVTLLAGLGFYAYAALRRVPAAIELVAVALAGLAVVGPATLDLDGLVAPRPAPILAVAALELGLGWWRREVGRSLLGAACLVAGTTLVLPAEIGGVPRGPMVAQLVVVVALAVGAAVPTEWGRWLRTGGAVAVLLGCLIVLLRGPGSHSMVPPGVVDAYPLVMAVLLAGYGSWLGHRPSLVIAALILAAGLVGVGWKGYQVARQVVLGLDYLAVGMVLFALAVLTSVAKGGKLTQAVRPFRGKGPSPSEPSVD